ncbi:MAG: phenylalanine--tRNA ligase subunit alpha [Candidatus Moeniiplasma glomeromycotorum]|nr:phenylalanine--tRNA ligase subunit alpha [Candidatus Moeniiplasma glomeromycotorum]MCE8167251.1 phenylalanine--tRNA ligase subunit alpha [Candidatus Moeniiplasma glomeromycotorum]MCE8168736.1 phenylalanine--tRNA ligase subunit alpha [Candidatus Moeniiplasma glomeromycotorum]
MSSNNKDLEKKIIQEREKSFHEVEKVSEIENLKKKYFGKESIITSFFQQVAKEKDLIKKKRLGELINQWKKELVNKIENIKPKADKLNKAKILPLDIYLEGKKLSLGNLHPITQIIYQIQDIFSTLGYQIVESPEIENEEYNFNKLNMPPGHPARDMHDTFYLDFLSTNAPQNKLLLRTHTSNTQIRTLETNPNQELKIITAGKVYRRDEDDATHTHQFTQMEGFRVGRNISFTHLKGTLELILKELFGNQYPFRFRPSYFPFTEPSVEVDVQCVQCRQKGCSVCKKTGWVEVLGAGLIHPQVLKNCGFDSQKFTGFAFGLGIERLLMIKYGIEDIRHFYLNDLRFLSQFRG